jgi:hypothetical protein
MSEPEDPQLLDDEVLARDEDAIPTIERVGNEEVDDAVESVRGGALEDEGETEGDRVERCDLGGEVNAKDGQGDEEQDDRSNREQDAIKRSDGMTDVPGSSKRARWIR